jgi:hypothetical protein
VSAHVLTHDIARAIYEYAGTNGLPDFDDLAPTVQISYIEEAEAALNVVCLRLYALAVMIEDQDEMSDHDVVVKATLKSLIRSFNPKNKESL